MSADITDTERIEALSRHIARLERELPARERRRIRRALKKLMLVLGVAGNSSGVSAATCKLGAVILDAATRAPRRK